MHIEANQRISDSIDNSLKNKNAHATQTKAFSDILDQTLFSKPDLATRTLNWHALEAIY
ncbi:MAG: hypothetical protein ACRER8_17525 [Pseudomonas sp.]|uniref:hypothetical protein n=1 Tax=Pseudomonas sp. TaxID=306 RepID=UPI003D6E292D